MQHNTDHRSHYLDVVIKPITMYSSSGKIFSSRGNARAITYNKYLNFTGTTFDCLRQILKVKENH
jgi:hypothetical protein